MVLDETFTNQYAGSEACLMSRMRDMTDTSGAIVWATQMQRQLETYSTQVMTILGKEQMSELEQDPLGKELVGNLRSFKVSAALSTRQNGLPSSMMALITSGCGE